jgi:hypothetical protein
MGGMDSRAIVSDKVPDCLSNPQLQDEMGEPNGSLACKGPMTMRYMPTSGVSLVV